MYTICVLASISLIFRSPEEAIRVTNRGLVRERIRQFSSFPSSCSTDSLHTIVDTYFSSELSRHRMSTVCESDIMRKKDSKSLTNTRKRPSSHYITNTSNLISSSGDIKNLSDDAFNTTGMYYFYSINITLFYTDLVSFRVWLPTPYGLHAIIYICCWPYHEKYDYLNVFSV